MLPEGSQGRTQTESDSFLPCLVEASGFDLSLTQYKCPSGNGAQAGGSLWTHFSCSLSFCEVCALTRQTLSGLSRCCWGVKKIKRHLKAQLAKLIEGWGVWRENVGGMGGLHKQGGLYLNMQTLSQRSALGGTDTCFCWGIGKEQARAPNLSVYTEERDGGREHFPWLCKHFFSSLDNFGLLKVFTFN